MSPVSNEAAAAIKSLLFALRVKDPITFSHCCRVGRLSRRLAQAAGLSPKDQLVAEYAGLLHDVGKMGVSDAILSKPDRLTPVEMEVMKMHPIWSAEMLRPLVAVDSLFADILPGVLHHHERIDGLGYPQGLAGEQVPLTARIVLISDTYDAMTEDRQYRSKLPSERAFSELNEYANRQFDAALVKIFYEAMAFLQAAS